MGSGWDLDDHLVTGKVNGPVVKAIVKAMMENSTFLHYMSKYAWPKNHATKYVKSVLTQQYNHQQKDRRNSLLSIDAQKALRRKGTFQSRKSFVSYAYTKLYSV